MNSFALRTLLLLLGVCTVFALVGCGDSGDKGDAADGSNDGSSDADDDATGSMDGSDDGDVADAEIPIPDVTGTFLLTVDYAFYPGSEAAEMGHFLVTWTLEQDDDPATLSASFQPLRVQPGGTFREAVGDPIISSDIEVEADGTFAATVVGTIPGAASPTGGDAALNAMVLGTIASADSVCGTVTGTAAGIDLAGSTFGAIRITDTTPANLPTSVIACP